MGGTVSKLFRAYRLYNNARKFYEKIDNNMFQSSFELTGYITTQTIPFATIMDLFQSSFELTGYITSGHSGRLWPY